MLSARELVANGKDLWREASADDASDFAAGLAYRFFLALFPFFIFMTAVGGVISNLVGAENPAGEILDRIGGALPESGRS